jgi:hypothetical protein
VARETTRIRHRGDDDDSPIARFGSRHKSSLHNPAPCNTHNLDAGAGSSIV